MLHIHRSTTQRNWIYSTIRDDPYWHKNWTNFIYLYSIQFITTCWSIGISRPTNQYCVVCVWVYLIRSTYFFSHGCDTLSVHKTKRVLSLTHSMGSLLDPMGFIIESLTPNVQMVNAPTKKKTHFISLFFTVIVNQMNSLFSSYYINETNSSLSKER